MVFSIPENEWDCILRILKRNEKEAVYRKWFAPIKFVSSNDTELVLAVPDAEFQAQLITEYWNVIDFAKIEAGIRKRLIFALAGDLKGGNRKAAGA